MRIEANAFRAASTFRFAIPPLIIIRSTKILTYQETIIRCFGLVGLFWMNDPAHGMARSAESKVLLRNSEDEKQLMEISYEH